MPSAICTLFEGHYHYGLAGLTNSLYRQGFRGSIYAGYRGILPPWTSRAKDSLSLEWKGSLTLDVAEGLQVHFLPVDTDYHLTNYKPDFMLNVWEGIGAAADKMFYFDPDIVVVKPWQVFAEWATCGVALSEDVNSPLSKLDPRRVAWRRYFGEKGIPLQFKDPTYVNGGFLGLTRANKGFLYTWQKIQETMSPLIGGLNQTLFKKDRSPLLVEAGGPFKPFLKTDQDALNASIEACDQEISFIGKEAMGFENGFILMYHALGSPKPWSWPPFRQSLRGVPPRKVDIEYWNAASGPIVALSPRLVSLQIFAMQITTGIGRFYKRN